MNGVFTFLFFLEDIVNLNETFKILLELIIEFYQS